MLKTLASWFTKSLPRADRRRSGRVPARLNVETLEGREMFAAQPSGLEYQVNSTTTNDQTLASSAQKSVATDANGDYVVVWTSNGDIYAQRYGADGLKDGAEFLVNTTTTGAQSDAVVAMDASGNFVIVWQSIGQDGDGAGLYAQRYNAKGLAQGVEFQVNQVTTGDQGDAAVAMDQNGNFIVTWTSAGQDGSGAGIYARTFTAAGTAKVSEFRVNTFTTGDQQSSSVAAASNGAFVITWESTGQDGLDRGIYAQRYTAAAAVNGAEFRVNTYTTGAQYDASIGMDSAGNFVVAWTSAAQDGSGTGVYAQRYTYKGAKQGNEFRVNTATANNQGSASVAMSASGIFITWTSLSQDGDVEGVFAQKLTAAGAADGSEFLVNKTTTGSQTAGAVAMSANGDTVVVWNSSDGDGQGVFSQRYEYSAQVQYVAVSGPGSVIDEGAWLVDKPTSIIVQFNRQMSTTGDTSVALASNWRLTLNGVNVSSRIAGVSYSYNAATGKSEAVITFNIPLDPGLYVLTANDAITSAAGERLDGEANGAAGGKFNRTFAVGAIGPVGSEFQVNQTTTNSQKTSGETGQAVAIDADGNYVVVWTSSGQDGSGAGVYARLYNSNGLAISNEFLVNVTTTGDQIGASVAMDEDGDFVVVWSSNGQDGSSYGIYARRFDASGSALSSEFRVNSYTTGSQTFGTIAMDADGDFVVVWTSTGQDGNGMGVYGQRYNASGVAQGGEFRVNTFTVGPQGRASVAMDDDGDFVVVWNGYGDGGYGIYGQRFSATGAALDDEFRVVKMTTGNNYTPSIAMNADGAFVVVWTELNADNHDYGLYGRLYTSAGFDVGTKFRINTYTTGAQVTPNVGMNDDGSFVVVWASNLQDKSSLGVYGQQFNALADKVGGEFLVTTTTTQSQQEPSLAMNSSGEFVVVWSDSAKDGSSFGVFGQRFTVNTPPSAVTLTNYNVVEGTAVGTIVGDLYAVDINGNDSFTYSLVTNPGKAFQIVGDQLVIFSAINYEAGATRSIDVKVTDRAGNSFTQTIVVNIIDVAPTVPTDNNAAANTVVEGAKGGTLVGVTARSTDVAGGTPVYTLSDSAGGRFVINSSSGVVTVAKNALIDHESSGGAYTIEVLVTVGGLTAVQTFTINVTNAPPTAPVDVNAGTNFIAEGAAAGTPVGITASASDPAGGGITYSLTNDAGGRFEIDSTTGVVTVKSGAVIDFETDGGYYKITVQASDGTVETAADFLINIGHPTATAFIATDPVNSGLTSLFVYGTTGNDNIKVVLKGGQYTVTLGKTTLGTFAPPTGGLYIYGGAGNDAIDVGITTTLDAFVDGGLGNDTIYGGAGNDVLLGRDGNDTISGRGGRDVIIGGTGVDRITGDGKGATAANEGNLMIGDSTDFDSNLAALAAIRAAWVANDVATETTIRSYLTSSTIHGDGAADGITQTKLGIDWAFAFELKTNGQRLDSVKLATVDRLN